MENDYADILYLMYRPAEPSYVPKGKDKVAFKVPQNYLPGKYLEVATEIFERFRPKAERIVEVKKIVCPDIGHLKQLERDDQFSIFIPTHQRLASELIRIFMSMPTFEDLLSVAAYCRDQLNPNMFIYAFSVVILHRADTQHLSIPLLTQIFPDKFFPGEILANAKKGSTIVGEGLRPPIKVENTETATDLDAEHRVAYWREDVGVNLHHWHWHLVYPHSGDVSIVKKDRRGELFYYMHQQILARYNCERLCNQLDRVKRFINWRDPIPEAYFSKLDSSFASRTWPARPSGVILQDVYRPMENLHLDIQDMERWRDRIYEAIHSGYVIDTLGRRIALTEKDGIDILGDIVESTILSINPNIYGDIHNMGHNAIAYCHDPDNRHLELFGVMGDIAIAMRDPIFYRWHAFINSIFQQHKNTLPRYNQQQLDFPGIEMMDISVTTNNQRNVLNTFWSQSMVDVSPGLDFASCGITPVRIKHLNYADFKYNISVNNRHSGPRRGTVRIFMAPKLDERGRNFPLREQMNFMIEMDKFSVTLTAGRNKITRKSKNSSVTIPFRQTFPSLDKKAGGTPKELNPCVCGWPQHMLVPKGTKEGYFLDLFIMISDFNDDVVEQHKPSCDDAVSYCGLRDRKYPDARALGYPFDRVPNKEIDRWEKFLTGNMKAVQITVKLIDENPGALGLH